MIKLKKNELRVEIVELSKAHDYEQNGKIGWRELKQVRIRRGMKWRWLKIFSFPCNFPGKRLLYFCAVRFFFVVSIV